MKKELIDVIHELAAYYGIEVKKVDSKEAAGVFVKYNGKRVNMSELVAESSRHNISNETLVYKEIDCLKEFVLTETKAISNKKFNTFSFDQNKVS